MNRWVAALPLVAVAALAILFATFGLHHDPHVQPQALVGKQMPDLTLPSLDDGAQVKLRDALKDGPVLVNFFASWCGPCELDQPALLGIKERGVHIIGVAYEDVPPRGGHEKTKAFLARLGDPFLTRVTDDDGRAGIDFGITGVPETYLVGRDGRILAKHTGPLGEAEARALAIQALTAR
jgi:cytochrome c biogenesis protein CcmG/thiol:disulfide interchange protein DsbE